MAADLGLSPEILETDESPPDKGPAEKMVVGASLMERLRSRCGQHKSWSDTIKTMKMALMNDKRHHSDALEKPMLQANLDKLQRAMKIINQQSLVERLDLISRQLGLIFTPPTPPENHISLCSDMFKVVIVLDGQSGIKDVRIGHQENPTSCEDLVEVLSNGVFDEFIKHLQGLLAIYSIEGDRKQKTKGYLALSSLESDLNLLAQLQSSISGVANYIHKSPLGILLPRRGGHPMKLIYFVSPYDLLCKRTLSSYPMTVEAITENDVGHSVTICMEPSLAINKLQTMPLMSVKTNIEGKSMPLFQAPNNMNSYSLPASFVLVLPQPVPIAESVIRAIQDITGLDVICGEKKPLLQVLVENFTDSKMSNSRQLFVTLPDQQHVYFLHDTEAGCLSQPGALISKIPFKHPTSVPNILNLLRQQLMFNSVIQSLVRPCAQLDNKTAVVFELTAMSLQYLSVMFEHPLENSMVTVEFDLVDITSVKCRLCMNNRDETICSNDFVSRAFQRCFSIPVTLRTVLHKVRQQLLSLTPPEPVQKTVTKLCMKWTSRVPVKAVPSATNLNTNVPRDVVSNLPNNPPQYPTSDSWMQGSQLDVRKVNVPLNRNFMEPPAPSEDRQPANPLLATLLDAGSPAVEAAAPVPTQPSIVNESPMLSKLLEENTSVATNPFPAPTPKRRLTKRKSSKDMIAGKSPKHRLSDSDMAERTSTSVPSGERYGQGIAEKHIDLDSSGGSYDSEPQRPASVSSVGSVGGQSTGSVIDLTDIGESHVKKLENSLDSIMQKESRGGGVNVTAGPGMNSQAAMLDMMDVHMHMPDFHGNPGMPPLAGDPTAAAAMMADFQQPQQWGNNRQTPPAPGLRNSPHHRVMPKNEKISTSLEELLLGPGGRECEGPNSLHGRRNSQQQQLPPARRHSLKRQNSAGRSSLDSSTGMISPDVFFPSMTSPSYHPAMSPGQFPLPSPNQLVSPGQFPLPSPNQLVSPGQFPLPSPNQLVSPGSLFPTTSPSHSTVTSPSHPLALANIKMEAFETKPAMVMSTQSVTSVPRMSLNTVHAVTSGKPSLSALKAQLEMKNDVTSGGCSLSQERDFKQDENSNSSTGSQPPLMKLKLSNMRQYDSISPADSEDSSKARSSTFDFHSDDEDTLPLVDKIMVVSASPTRLQISNKTTIASFNKFNKSEKFKRKEREKEMKLVPAVEEPVGKRKRDRDETRRERKKKRVSNNTYSVEKEMAVYKSTTVDVEGSTENNKYKPMPKLKITKSGIKMIENNSVQLKELKPVVEKQDSVKIEKDSVRIEKIEKDSVRLEKDSVKIEKIEKDSVKLEKDSVRTEKIEKDGIKNEKIAKESVKIEKLDKQAIVKIEKVEKFIKKEREKDASIVIPKSVKENKEVKEVKEVKEKEKLPEKVEKVHVPAPPVSKSSVSDEGIFDRINAMKTENVVRGDSDPSSGKNSPLNTNTVNSKKSSPSVKTKPSHKSQRSNSSTRTEMKIRTPTIKLKPIVVPHSSASGVRTQVSQGSATTPSTPKSVAQSPTSTTIGKIGAVSLATSGVHKSLVPTSNSKSPQGQSSKSSSSSGSATSKSSSSGSTASVLSSKQMNNSQKNIQAQNSSGKNSPIPQSNKSRNSSLSSANSLKLEKSKSLSSSNCRTSSPLSEREKSKMNSSSRSSSLGGRERDKSTSSSKNSVPDKTIITQKTAASVLSFLNPKANKISSLPPIPKLSSASGGQKVSTPTSSTNTTIVSSSSISTSANTSPSNTSSRFAKASNSSSSSYNKGVNSNFTGANTAKSLLSSGANSAKSSLSSGANSAKSSLSSGANTAKSSQGSVSSSQKSSYSFNKSNSGSYPNSHNKQHGSAVTSAVNASRTSNNSPVNYIQKNSSNSYNKGNNTNSANNTAFRNSSSNNVGHSRSSSLPNSSMSGQSSSRASGTSASHSPHKGGNSNMSGQGSHRGNNPSSSGNKGGSSTSSSSSRPSSVMNSSANASNFRGSNTGPNAPKGPGPPGTVKQSVSSSDVEEVSKGKSHTTSQPPVQPASRGRKGSLSAVIDKLTCKATIPPYLNSSTNVSKGEKVIIDESPASPEPEGAKKVEKKGNDKVVIFEAPASPEPDNSSVSNSVKGPGGSTVTHSDKIVSIPLDQQLSQNSDSGSNLSGETSEKRKRSSDIPERVLPKSAKSDFSSSPKVIPLDSTRDSYSHNKHPFSVSKLLTKQRSFDNSSPQQNGDISSDESAKLKAIDKSIHKSESSSEYSNVTKAQDTKISSAVTDHTKVGAFKVPSPKTAVDSKTEDTGKRKFRSNSSVKSIPSPESPPSSPDGLMIDCSLSPGQNDTSSPQCNPACDNSVSTQDRTSPNYLKSLGMKNSQAKRKNSPSESPVGKDNSTENSGANSPCFLDDDLMDEALGLGN